jgi:hypothetical protein
MKNKELIATEKSKKNSFTLLFLPSKGVKSRKKTDPKVVDARSVCLPKSCECHPCIIPWVEHKLLK